MSILDEINDSSPDGVESVSDDGCGHVAGGCNGVGVAEDHSEALLENGFLAEGSVEVVLEAVVGQVALQLGVRDEGRLRVVNVFSLLPLVVDLLLRVDAPLGHPRQVCVDLERKRSEAPDVHVLPRL